MFFRLRFKIFEVDVAVFITLDLRADKVNISRRGPRANSRAARILMYIEWRRGAWHRGDGVTAAWQRLDAIAGPRSLCMSRCGRMRQIDEHRLMDTRTPARR